MIKKVTNLIDEFLLNKINCEAFLVMISDLYGSTNPEWDKLNQSEQTFVYDVYEKSTYTSDGLSKDDGDRKYGVIDCEDLKSWLKIMKSKNIIFWN